MKKKIILFAFVFIVLNILTFVNVQAINLSLSDVLVLKTNKVTCGGITDIPAKIPELTSFVVTLLQVAIPVILVIMGTIDLFKGISASKDDEIKKGQHMLVKRLIVAALIFFVVAIVKFVIGLVSNGQNTDNMISCIDCFISGECKSSGTFVCSVDGYDIVYYSSGVIKGIQNKSGDILSNIHHYYSEFEPANPMQCPTSNNAVVELKSNINNGLDLYVKKK